MDTFNELADNIDSICHASALVDWMRPLSDYIGPNVISAHEILRLASSGREKAVHVISTLATLPMHLGYYVPEEDREYGYSISKYMAEKMVAAARWRGAKASVYRIPFVTASTLGHFRLDRGDFLHNMIVESIELGYFIFRCRSLGSSIGGLSQQDHRVRHVRRSGPHRPRLRFRE